MRNVDLGACSVGLKRGVVHVWPEAPVPDPVQCENVRCDVLGDLDVGLAVDRAQILGSALAMSIDGRGVRTLILKTDFIIEVMGGDEATRFQRVVCCPISMHASKLFISECCRGVDVDVARSVWPPFGNLGRRDMAVLSVR